MTQWHPIAACGRLATGESCEIVVAGSVLALFRVDDGYFALDGVCAHQGGPLGQGRLQGCVVTCPWHGWQYDVRDGQHQSIAPLRQRSYPLKVENDTIYVALDS